MKTKRTDFTLVPACKCHGRYVQWKDNICPDCLKPFRKYFTRTPAQVKANERNWTLKQLKMIDAAINHPILQRNVHICQRVQITTAVQDALSVLK